MRIIALCLFALILPVAHADAGPDSGESDGAAKKPQIEKLSDSEYRFGEIRFRRDTREITFPAKINMNQDFLEYILVHENGKLHESLLSTSISPYHLQIVLLLCGYKPGLGNLFDGFMPPPAPESPAAPPAEKAKAPDPDQFLVAVEWEAGGEKKSARIEDWILNLVTNAAMTRGSWAYTGSRIEDSKFQAEVEGSIFAIYLDELALGNYPGPGNDRDDIWIPFAEKMPPLNSDVRVILRPALRKSPQPE